MIQCLQELWIDIHCPAPSITLYQNNCQYSLEMLVIIMPNTRKEPAIVSSRSYTLSKRGPVIIIVTRERKPWRDPIQEIWLGAAEGMKQSGYRVWKTPKCWWGPYWDYQYLYTLNLWGSNYLNVPWVWKEDSADERFTNVYPVTFW